MLHFKKLNFIAELSYYVRENEEFSFLEAPCHNHIYVSGLIAELTLEEELVVSKEVAFSLLLLSMEDLFDFDIVVDGNIVDCKSLVFKNLVSLDEYQDKSDWYKLYDTLEEFCNSNDNSEYKIARFKTEEPFVGGGEVHFVVNELLDPTGHGSVLEVGKVFVGVLDDKRNNIIHFTDANEREWIFFVGDTCDIVFARKCSVTGEGMNEGFIINDDFYAKNEELALEEVKKRGYASLQEAYDEEICFFTEWDVINDAQYKLVNGLIVEI